MKQRHIKTIQEKYGYRNVYDLAIEVLNANYKMDKEELFDLLPYVGYLRIDVNNENDRWWYYTDEDIVNAKILRVNDLTVDLCHYDSHHHQISFCTPDFQGFVVEGNILKKLK